MYICVQCGRILRIVKNGVYAEELTDITPYRIWSTDKWGCPECRFEILVTAPMPSSEYWQDSYAKYDERVEVRFN